MTSYIDHDPAGTYARFIGECRAKPRPEQGEWHHVVPRSQWPEGLPGRDEPSNLVFLSYCDHIEAHWLYAKETDRCWKAVVRMTNGSLGKRVNADVAATISQYAAMREEALSKSRKPLSQEARKKIGDSQRGTKRGPFTDEHKRRLAASRLGMKFTSEHVMNMRRVRCDQRVCRWRLPNGEEFVGMNIDVIDKIGEGVAGNMLRLIGKPNSKSCGVSWLETLTSHS